jgi:hypothetical protein
MDTSEPDQAIVANGVNGATGAYLLPPQTEQQVAESAAGEPQDTEQLNVLRELFQQSTQPHLGALFDVDLTDPKDAGWAIVFHTDEDPAVKAAFQPLIEHRQRQIGNDSIVKVLEYRDGEMVPQWLVRHKIGLGDIDPEKMPFYILLVGSPSRIPFLFGHLLDAVYGVGRLYFDTNDDYKAYIASVIDYETAGSIPNSKEVYFFGPQHIADQPTRLSATSLVKPLGGVEAGQPGVLDRLAKSKFKLAYNGHYLAPEASTKQALQDVFRPAAGKPTPALLFTASHGLGWPLGDTRQKSAQGALLCQDFPGIGLGPVKPEHYFAASDLPADARVKGLVCFHFACFGVGTPKDDRFRHTDGVVPPDIARDPFFSALPQALLSHPNGSALGVIGHVERAWPNSITTTGAGVQLLPFTNAISYILLGNPLGYALKDFNERYAALSTSLGAMLEKKGFGLPISDSDLATTWTARNDAEAYVLFGDPLVSIRKELLA